MRNCGICNKVLVGRQKRFCSDLCKDKFKSIDYKTKYKGKGNPFYGKHHTKEVIQKLRDMASKRVGKNAANYRHGRCANNPKEYNRIYNLTYNKKYREENYEKLKKLAAKWREKNRDKVNESCYRWKEKNREKYRQIQRACKFRRRAIGNIDKQILQEVYEENIREYGTLTCYLCKKRIHFGNDSVDHKIPISKGGTNAKDNLAITHLVCNIRKNSKLLSEMEGIKNDK